MDTAEILRRQIDRAEKRLAQLEAIPDPALMPVETVIFWKRTFRQGSGYVPVPHDSISYMYVALRVPDGSAALDGAHWYVTGSQGRERYTDDELREMLAHETVSDRYVVETWLGLEAYVPASPFETEG